MLTIEKFLWCLELETGVNLIGYFGIFSSLVLAIAFLLTSAFNYEEVLSYIKERLIVHHKTDVPGIQIAIIFLLVLAALLVNIYISISLVRGVQHQKYRLFKPFLGIEILFIFLLIMETLTSLKFMYFVLSVIHCYFWISVYSLYECYKIDSRVKLRISTVESINQV